MPIYSRGINDAARRDLHRILAGRPPAEEFSIRHCSQVLFGMLRYDPDHLGLTTATNQEVRFFAWGMLRFFFRVRPEDRLVVLDGVGLNAEWQP